MTQLDLGTFPSIGTVPIIAAPPAGRRVGPWQLVQLAAQGSLAEIWRARPSGSPTESPADYAVKLLLPRWEDHPEALAMLQREATVGHEVTHPHLIPVLASGVADRPYLVMPWLAGQSLAARLSSGRRLDLPVALWIIRQAAEALEALEKAGWTHGDIKPGNIFLTAESHVTLLDLGFARRCSEPRLLAEHCLAGTCYYLAPEAITSALGPDIRADIYSLGVVLFEMLAGRVPFEGRNVSEVLARHRENRAPNLRALAPNLPPAVASLVAGMLAKHPLHRPQTPGELIRQVAGLEILTFAER